MSYHGYNPINAAEEQALPNATTGYTTAFQYGGKSAHKQILKVFANTDIAIATGQAISIELVTGSTSTPTGSVNSNSHLYLLHKTSADDAIAADAGDLLCEIGLPEDMMTKDYYYRLKIVTDANESTEKIDVLLVAGE